MTMPTSRRHAAPDEEGSLCEPGGIVWFVINLDRAPHRLAGMRQRALELDLSFVRIAATDGRSLPASLPGVDADLFRISHGRSLRADEIGCFVSHLRALRAFLASPHRFAMVLEDDAVLTPEVVRLARDLTADGAPDDWDQVKFEAHHGRYGLPVRRLSDRHRLCAMPFKMAGSAAYLVNRRAAERLLDRLLPMRFPYDIAFDRGWEWGLRIRAILPLPVTAANEPSTIDRDTEAPERRRRPARARLETKLRHVAAACRAWYAPARRFDVASDSAPSESRLLVDAMEAELSRRAGPVV